MASGYFFLMHFYFFLMRAGYFFLMHLYFFFDTCLLLRISSSFPFFSKIQLKTVQNYLGP